MAQLGSTNVYGDLSVTGSETVSNLQVTTINGVAVGSSPKFTDNDHITSATTNGSGNAVTSVTSDSNGALTVTKGTTFLTSHQTVTSNNNTASWGSAVTVGTVGSTDLKFTMPSNPDTNTWRPIGTGSTDCAAGNHTHSQYLTSHQSVSSANNTATWSGTVVVGTVGSTDLKFTMPANPNTDNDTKNTAGSTNYSAKLFLIGAPTQAANPATYSNSSVYETNGTLYATSFKTGSSWTQSTDSSGNLVFTYG